HDAMAEVPRERLIADMVGRELQDIYDYRTRDQGGMRLEARGLHSERLPAPLSFGVRGGEVLGFFGLVGAGRSELMRLLYGADRRRGGEVLLDGQPVSA